MITARQQLRLESPRDLTALNTQIGFFTYMSDALVFSALSLTHTPSHPAPGPVIFHPPGLLHASAWSSHRIVVSHGSWLPRSRKPKLPGHLRTVPRTATASVLPYSLNRGNHRENPRCKAIKNRLQFLVGKWQDHVAKEDVRWI